jgi:hypothetical protein
VVRRVQWDMSMAQQRLMGTSKDSEQDQVCAALPARPSCALLDPRPRFNRLLRTQLNSRPRRGARRLGRHVRAVWQLKSILLDTNPVLLAVTVTVSVLHTVFDFLAFKNDISFWRKVDNMQGLSVRSIFTSVITQTIIFLYLLDNDTSWVILFSSGIGKPRPRCGQGRLVSVCCN